MKRILQPLLNLLIFSKPTVLNLDYLDYVFENKGYFLLSWKFEKGYRLKIKSLRFCSYKQSGSAYKIVPTNTDIIEIQISNFWRTTKTVVPLLRTPLDVKTDFDLIANSKDFNINSAGIPGCIMKNQNIIVELSDLKVKNLLSGLHAQKFIKP